MSDIQLCLLMRTHSRELRIHEPKHEFRFCDDRKWRFDFAWPGVKIAIEVREARSVRRTVSEDFIAAKPVATTVELDS